MDLWTYTALLAEWNAIRAADGEGDPIEPPSADKVRRSFAQAAEKGMLH